MSTLINDYKYRPGLTEASLLGLMPWAIAEDASSLLGFLARQTSCSRGYHFIYTCGGDPMHAYVALHENMEYCRCGNCKEPLSHHKLPEPVPAVLNYYYSFRHGFIGVSTRHPSFYRNKVEEGLVASYISNLRRARLAKRNDSVTGSMTPIDIGDVVAAEARIAQEGVDEFIDMVEEQLFKGG